MPRDNGGPRIWANVLTEFAGAVLLGIVSPRVLSDRQQVCRDDDTRRETPNDPDRHDSNWYNSQILGEGPPYGQAHRHSQGDTDDDRDEGHRCGLPSHRRGHLMSDETRDPDH